MQMLYQWELSGNTPEQVSESFFRERTADQEVAGFARELFRGAVNEIRTLDHTIAEHAQNWKLERMAAVDRGILRMATYELLRCPDTPPQAVINEALEIARRFSGEDSVQFINGILDSVLKQAGRPRLAEPDSK